MAGKYTRVGVVVLCLVGLALAPSVGVVSADDHDPYPYITDVDVPDSVTVGESFTVDVTARNYGGPAGKYSTISLSSPTLDGYAAADQARIVSHSFRGYTAEVAPGDQIWTRNSNQKDADYLLIEGGTNANDQWGDHSSRSMSVEFTPEEAGTFVIYVRTTMTDGEGDTITDPDTSSHTDQQGYAVKRYEVEVREKPNHDATIERTDVDGGDYERGDTVDTSVKVENTGNRADTFYVGHGVYDEVGQYYDNDGSTHESVTLDVGESKWVDVEWTAEDDARAGTYDTRVSVWNESNGGKLYERLADDWEYNSFRVREEPNIDAAIRNIDVDSGDFQYGESVDASVTVENTGNRQHTYFVGYSVSSPSNRYYDNDGTTGKTVTLAPGESQTVDLSWTVEDGLQAGQYDAIFAVWKESDRDSLYTRLDGERTANHFAVRPERDVTFSVSKKSSIDGFRFDGEPIPGATVQLDGRTYTTDADGDVSLTLPVDTYDFTVSADGYETLQGEISMSASSGSYLMSVPLVRENVGVVETDVVDNDGQALGGNMYRLLVDGEHRIPNRRGELLLEAGRHTITAEPTDFGSRQNLVRVSKEIPVESGKRTTATLNPEADIDAEIAEFNPDTGTVGPGTEVDGMVTVKNTAPVEHTFFVGFGARSQDGTAYNNDGQTGRTVTLAPDETRTVEVTWHTDEGAPTGVYDLTAAVWEDSDRNSLQTKLDDATVSDAVELSLAGSLSEDENETITDYARSDATANVFEPVTYDGNVYLIGYTSREDGSAVDYVGDANSPKRVFADSGAWSAYDVRRTFVFERTTSGLDFVPKSQQDVIGNVTRTQAALYWSHSKITRTPLPRYTDLHDQMLHSPRAEINFWFENTVGSALKSEEDRYLASLQAATTASSDYALIPDEAAADLKEAKSATESANTALSIAQDYDAQKYVKVAGERVDSEIAQDALNKYASNIKKIDTDRIGYAASLVDLVMAISERQTYKTRRVQMLNRVQSYTHDTPDASLPDGLDAAITELDTQHRNSNAQTVEAVEQWAKENGVEFGKVAASKVGTKFGSWLVTKSSYAASVSSWATSSTAGTLASSAASLAGSGLLGWQIGGVLTGRGASYAALMKAEYSLNTSESLEDVRQDIRDRYGNEFTTDGSPPQADAAEVFHSATYVKRLALVNFHQQDAAAIEESILGEYEAFLENNFDREAYAREKKTDFLDQAERGQTFARKVRSASTDEVLTAYASSTGARASIRSVSHQAETVQTGDSVPVTVTVENTGRERHTFFVGYSAVAPDGTTFDNDGTTGTTVTIAPGATETVTIDWTAQQQAPTGTYDTVVAVWEERDRDALETRLDAERTFDVVTVERPKTLSQLSVDVANISECDGVCRELNYTIENPTTATFENVDVDVELYTNGTLVWEGTQTFAEISPGTQTGTSVVKPSEEKALLIAENDYQVRVDVTVSTADDSRTVTVEKRL